MNLLVTFFIIVCLGIVGVAWVGIFVDQMTSPFTSLLIAFPMLFATIWLAWKVAVKVTEPKSPTNA
ncbi:MAG: hypothetical protein GEU95_19580 [Rhizobiales bacterium]|nr:hypothetical protein [Hyphomicrobiales bacterium]